MSALPKKRLVDSGKALAGVIILNNYGGIISICLLFAMTIFEGLSAHYTLIDLKLASILLTTSYSVWSIVLCSASFGIFASGKKILSLVHDSIEMQKRSTGINEGTSNFEQIYSELKFLAPLICMGVSTGGFSILIINLARYYVWTERSWPLLSDFTFCFITGVSGLLGISYVFFKDIYMRYVKKIYSSPRHQANSSNPDTSGKSRSNPLGSNSSNNMVSNNNNGTELEVVSTDGAYQKKKTPELQPRIETELGGPEVIVPREKAMKELLDQKAEDDIISDFRKSIKN